MIQWMDEDTPLELLGWNFISCNENCPCPNTNCPQGYGTQAEPCQPPPDER